MASGSKTLKASLGPNLCIHARPGLLKSAVLRRGAAWSGGGLSNERGREREGEIERERENEKERRKTKRKTKRKETKKRRRRETNRDTNGDGKHVGAETDMRSQQTELFRNSIAGHRTCQPHDQCLRIAREGELMQRQDQEGSSLKTMLLLVATRPTHEGIRPSRRDVSSWRGLGAGWGRPTVPQLVQDNCLA